MDAGGIGRLRIGVFGRTGVGKTSLIHALAGSGGASAEEEACEVESEVPALGQVIFYDTNGIDLLGAALDRTRELLDHIDIALFIFDHELDVDLEKEWTKQLDRRGIPIVGVINKIDVRFLDFEPLLMRFKFPFIRVSTTQKKYFGSLFSAVRFMLKNGNASEAEIS